MKEREDEEMALREIEALLLRRAGLVFVEPSRTTPHAENVLQALDVELAALGYAASTKLRARMALVDDVAGALRSIGDVLREQLGDRLGDRKHEPLYRSFPHDIPSDMAAQWWQRVLTHYLQAPEQPCLWCGRTSTTHVLNPCAHVVCDRCFDGSNVSGCPVCGHKVDRASPFFTPSAERPLPKERVTFKRLDVTDDVDADARALFVSLCSRAQALSPRDREDLVALVRGLGVSALRSVPETIPVKENVAHVFGTLLREHPDNTAIVDAARPRLKTATDVLRLLAAYSGADPSLQGAKAQQPKPLEKSAPKTKPRLVRRFKVAKIRRPLRRALLAHLASFDATLLVEDMLRHRSYWVWLGEFLHPHEYADRWPTVARAFHVVRKYDPAGNAAPDVPTFHRRLERALGGRDANALVDVLRERPGELARRFDLALRIAGDDVHARTKVVDAFVSNIARFSTPVLLMLSAYLPTRLAKAPVRIYWPKGKVARGVSAPDKRTTLAADVVAPAVTAIDAELLARFEREPAFDAGVVDEALAHVMVPFNERTAAKGAVSLPRGSRLALPPGKTLRLFLHWCQPENGGTTDLDLSVAFYDDAWNHSAVCSYYQLKADDFATSAGDFTSAPHPDGATEFVDIDRARALAAGNRYAVAVINAYRGLPFDKLERAFAGLMLRDDVDGAHFDPRTVALKFDLAGDNGVFLPLVVDLKSDTMWWLDVHAKGELEMNNVETSNNAITKLAPEMMTYFASGVRPSMHRLALLHAAARCRRVLLRAADGTVTAYVRGNDSVAAFHGRIANHDGGERLARGVDVRDELGAKPVLAALLHGDVELPAESTAYALFSERITRAIAAADLL